MSAARRSQPGALAGTFDRFGDVALALEQAAAALARLQILLAGHPLTPAWLWRARLEAASRRDDRGCAIPHGPHRGDHRPWCHLRRGPLCRCPSGAVPLALSLWRWFAGPDAARTEATRHAAAALAASGHASPLLGAVLGIRAWLDCGGERPLRAPSPSIGSAAGCCPSRPRR